MVELFGWTVLAVGMVLFIASFALTVRANPAGHDRHAEHQRWHALIGAAALIPTLGYGVPIVTALPSIVMPATIAAHNRKITVAT
ncbi:hypothetical protein [Microbacterium sp. PF5]|uniref:hypothetical protein n=1 Tax=Microbacterium sp. PF5 TaxID=2305435 RepID=UPI00109BDEE0|nr:hypothetical protein [Microbacterium sp. PF5]